MPGRTLRLCAALSYCASAQGGLPAATVELHSEDVKHASLHLLQVKAEGFSSDGKPNKKNGQDDSESVAFERAYQQRSNGGVRSAVEERTAVEESDQLEANVQGAKERIKKAQKKYDKLEAARLDHAHVKRLDDKSTRDDDAIETAVLRAKGMMPLDLEKDTANKSKETRRRRRRSKTDEKEGTKVEEKGIVAYVQFGKAGSSSMRNILNQRAEHKGWEVQRHQARRCAESLCDMRLCTADIPYKRATKKGDKITGLDCADEPDGAVVQTMFPGYCEAVKGVRSCRYMTLLREPMSRLISSYNYWCRDCKDGAIFCHKNSDCPNLNITEWARRHGNDYTRRLSAIFGQPTAIAHGFYGNGGHTYELTDKYYQQALKFVTSNDTLVMTTDELDTAESYTRLASFLGDEKPEKFQEEVSSFRNSNDHSYQPTDDEVKELKKILKYDLDLYAAATSQQA